MNEIIKKLETELKNLKDKIEALTKFIYGKEYDKLNTAHQALLNSQHDHMIEYADILNIRITLLKAGNK